MEGYSLAIHFTPPQVYQKCLAPDQNLLGDARQTGNIGYPFVLSLKITFACLPRHNEVHTYSYEKGRAFGVHLSLGRALLAVQGRCNFNGACFLKLPDSM